MPIRRQGTGVKMAKIGDEIRAYGGKSRYIITAVDGSGNPTAFDYAGKDGRRRKANQAGTGDALQYFRDRGVLAEKLYAPKDEDKLGGGTVTKYYGEDGKKIREISSETIRRTKELRKRFKGPELKKELEKLDKWQDNLKSNLGEYKLGTFSKGTAKPAPEAKPEDKPAEKPETPAEKPKTPAETPADVAKEADDGLTAIPGATYDVSLQTPDYGAVGKALADSTKTPRGQMAWLTTLGLGSDLLQGYLEGLGPSVKYADKKIAELEEKEKKGELGRDKDLERDEMAEMMRPVRAMASEGRRQAEAVQAGMGETRSAAALGRLQREQARQVGEGVRQAGSLVSARRAQRAAQEIGQLESMYQYKQQLRERVLKRAFGGLGATAAQLGRIAAATAGRENLSYQAFEDMMPPEFKDMEPEERFKIFQEMSAIDAMREVGKQESAMQTLLGALSEKTGVTIPK